MQRQFTDKMSEFYKGISKPLSDLAELNIKTINKFTARFTDLAQVKKPENFLTAQIELTNATCMDSIQYAQEACGIILEAVTHNGNAFTDIVRETGAKASEAVKQSQGTQTRHKE